MLMRCLILICLLWPLSAAACDDGAPCHIAEGSYHMRLPDGWDGVAPLPVLIHFHGWMREGGLVVRHDRIASATRRRGVLLLAPNGPGKTWRFWDRTTPDVALAAAVLEDAARRYPIDRSRIYVSGYSYGSAMAWRYVCENGAEVAALLAIAGTLAQDETCGTAPGQVRHVHGLTDTVMDFPMGPGGDTTYPVALWRERLGCGAGVSEGAWNARPFLTFERTLWACDKGRVILDLHPGGHFIPHGWIARQLDEVMGLPNSYP